MAVEMMRDDMELLVLILKIKFVADNGTHLFRVSIFARKHRLVLSPNL